VGAEKDEVRAAIASLARRHKLDQRREQLLVHLAGRLAADPLAPTAVKAPKEIVDAHLADSLSALDLGMLSDRAQALRIADIGAGAGLPGLVLAIALPDCEILLIESLIRKCVFIDAVIAELDLPNASSICTRTEDWSGGRGRQDVVTARAIAPQSVVLEYAAPLLDDEGRLIDWRGRRDASDEQTALAAAAELGLEREEVVKVVPFPGAHDRHLHVFRKVAATPDRFPRRAGIARKRPLGNAPVVHRHATSLPGARRVMLRLPAAPGRVLS